MGYGGKSWDFKQMREVGGEGCLWKGAVRP